MDEHIEIWDRTGKPTGETALKSEVHKRGLFHPTAHVWFYTRGQKVLLQRRSMEKETFPGLWDVSVAGHISAGENPLEGAIREVEEEIGLNILPENLDFIGQFKAEQAHPGGIVDREIHHVYLSELMVPLEALRPDPSEVADLKLLSLLQFAEEIWGMADTKKYVPHSKSYYGTIIKALRLRF